MSIFEGKKHFIFDFDGTLVDSMPYFSQNLLEFLQQQKVDFPPDIIKIVTPLGYPGMARCFQEDLGMDMPQEQIIKLTQAAVYPAYRDIIPLKEGVYDYLRQLKDRGCKLHVLTASPHLVVDPCLQRLGVFDWFDFIWSCEDFGMKKSDPEIYCQAMERIGDTIESAVFFDDNIHSVQTAMKAGMKAVGCYDPTGEEFAQELSASADLYIHSFQELCD
jgi:HAD superfamily hydrolase (TIGR01509 family)